jgi:hypothetical protein
MKVHNLALACLVFLVLIGLLYWSEHRKPASEASADVPPSILKLDEAGITGVELKKKDAEPILLSKSSSGEWQITQPRPLAADQAAVSGMLAVLSSLNAERTLEDKAIDLKPYGLESPVLEVDITAKDKLNQKLLIGEETPSGQAVYAMRAGDRRIFTMASFNKTSLDKSLSDLRDKRLLKVDSGKISRIELVKGTQDIELDRNPSPQNDKTAAPGETGVPSEPGSGSLGLQWQITKPKPLRADSSQVDELARKLTDARMELGAGAETPPGQDAASAFAHATPLVTAKVTDPSGTQELQVRKSEDSYYAKSSAVEGIHKVSADLAQALDKGLDDFRNKKLFDFGYSDPNRVELHLGSQAYFLTRGGADWWSNGKKMDLESVESLLDKLRDLAGTSFPDSGFTNPAIEVTATSGDGKQVEKVLISQAGDHYVGKREKEPDLYLLDASSVDGLQKAAAALKPATVSGK